MGKALGWIDSHCHLTCADLIGDAWDVRQRALDAGVARMMIVCCRLEEAEAALKMKAEDARFDVAVGFHPSDLRDFTEEDWHKLETLVYNENVTAVGEIGLDYYWDKESHEIQKKWFEAQMEVARSERLPFIIHSREAAQDTLTMMKGLRAAEMSGGVIHCFSYSKEMAKEYLDMGLYIGIGGVVTFKNAKKLKEVAEYAPLEQILLETDCPYLAPVPHRGKRNTSLNLPYVAEEIARIKGISCEEVVEVTCRNAKKMFGIKD